MKKVKPSPVFHRNVGDIPLHKNAAGESRSQVYTRSEYVSAVCGEYRGRYRMIAYVPNFGRTSWGSIDHIHIMIKIRTVTNGIGSAITSKMAAALPRGRQYQASAYAGEF